MAIKKKSLAQVNKMRESTISKALNDNFGIEADPNAFKKDELVELYMTAQVAYLEENEPANEPANEPPEVESVIPNEKRIKINISKEKDEPAYVDVSVNGRASRIPRGIDVEVPESVLSVLNDCIQTFYEHDSETGENVPNDQPRFNIQVKG